MCVHVCRREHARCAIVRVCLRTRVRVHVHVHTRVHVFAFVGVGMLVGARDKTRLMKITNNN